MKIKRKLNRLLKARTKHGVRVTKYNIQITMLCNKYGIDLSKLNNPIAITCPELAERLTRECIENTKKATFGARGRGAFHLYMPDSEHVMDGNGDDNMRKTYDRKN